MIRYICKQTDELYHYGIKGQKWGVRRYQNPDGTYTDEGRKRKNWNSSYVYEDGSKGTIPNQKSKSLYKTALKKTMNDNFYDWKNGMSQDDVKKVKDFVNSRKNLKDFYDHEDRL